MAPSGCHTTMVDLARMSPRATSSTCIRCVAAASMWHGLQRARPASNIHRKSRCEHTLSNVVYPESAVRVVLTLAGRQSCKTECVNVLQNWADGKTAPIDVPLTKPHSLFPLASCTGCTACFHRNAAITHTQEQIGGCTFAFGFRIPAVVMRHIPPGWPIFPAPKRHRKLIGPCMGGVRYSSSCAMRQSMLWETRSWSCAALQASWIAKGSEIGVAHLVDTSQVAVRCQMRDRLLHG